MDGGVRDDVRSWMKALADLLGEKEASLLLKGEGDLPSGDH